MTKEIGFINGQSMWAKTVKHSQCWILEEVEPDQVSVCIDTYVFGSFKKQDLIEFFEKCVEKMKVDKGVGFLG